MCVYCIHIHIDKIIYGTYMIYIYIHICTNRLISYLKCPEHYYSMCVSP